MSWDDGVWRVKEDARPLEALRGFLKPQRQKRAGEVCEMCAVPIADEHSHVVNVEVRNLLCTCRRLLPALHRRWRGAGQVPRRAGPLSA